MASIKQVQDEIVNDGFLDDLGNDSTDYAGLGQFPSLEQFMIRSAAMFVLNIKQELNRQGKVSSGGLEDGISSGDLDKSGNGYTITVGWDKSDPASMYYDFVNKGVSGYANSRNNTPYKFEKKLNKKGGILIGSKMQKSILRWYKQRGLIGSRDDQTRNLSANQRRDRSLARVKSQDEKLKSIAYATAINIKKKGIKRSGFFDDTIDSMLGQSFLDALSKVVGQDVRVAIRQANNNINDNK